MNFLKSSSCWTGLIPKRPYAAIIMHCGSLKYRAVDSNTSHDLFKMANEETRDDSEEKFNTHTDPALIGLNGASEIETIVQAASEGKEQ